MICLSHLIPDIYELKKNWLKCILNMYTFLSLSDLQIKMQQLSWGEMNVVLNCDNFLSLGFVINTYMIPPLTFSTFIDPNVFVCVYICKWLPRVLRWEGFFLNLNLAGKSTKVNWWYPIYCKGKSSMAHMYLQPYPMC